MNLLQTWILDGSGVMEPCYQTNSLLLGTFWPHRGRHPLKLLGIGLTITTTCQSCNMALRSIIQAHGIDGDEMYIYSEVLAILDQVI